MDYNENAFDTVRDLQFQLDMAKQNSFGRNFMDGSLGYNHSGTSTTGYVYDYRKISERQRRIENVLTVSEYRILISTTFRDSRETIDKYIAILEKLKTEGIFDDMPSPNNDLSMGGTLGMGFGVPVSGGWFGGPPVQNNCFTANNGATTTSNNSAKFGEVETDKRGLVIPDSVIAETTKRTIDQIKAAVESVDEIKDKTNTDKD